MVKLLLRLEKKVSVGGVDDSNGIAGGLAGELVSGMCLSQREKKGFTLKQIALSLKVPQYRLKYIESSSVKNISVDILEHYIDHLGLRKWFDEWKKCNLDVYERLSKRKC